MRLTLLAAFCTAAVLPAQIDRMNHWQWAWLMNQRRAFLAEIVDADRERHSAIAELLTKTDESVPLLTLFRARAFARDVEADSEFLFRTGLQVIALPEVVDNAGFQETKVTIYAPHSTATGTLPMPGKFEFAIRVFDASGKEVWQGELPESGRRNALTLADLREFNVVAGVPTGDLPDGEYRVEVEVILDGVGPRAQDLPLTSYFTVMKGYGARAAAFLTAQPGGERRESVDEFLQFVGDQERLEQAVLLGVGYVATRAWYGKPGPDPRRAPRELLLAEQVRNNIESDRPSLSGISGPVTIGLPAGDAGLMYTTLRLPEGGLPAPGTDQWADLAAKPLVVFVSGRPALDSRGGPRSAPSAPKFTMPIELAESLEVAGFDRDNQFQIAVVESPGRVREFPTSLVEMVAGMGRVFPFDSDRMVFVGERHGGHGVVALAKAAGERCKGIVLVDTRGGLASVELRSLPHLLVLAIPGHGSDSAINIRLLRRYAESANKAGDVRILDDRNWPWCFALPLAAGPIEEFVQRVVR